MAIILRRLMEGPKLSDSDQKQYGEKVAKYIAYFKQTYLSESGKLNIFQWSWNASMHAATTSNYQESHNYQLQR